MSAALRRISGWPAAAVLVAVVILMVGIGQTSAGHAALRAAGLYSEPGGYTSLAFVHPQSLPRPTTLTAEQEKLSVAFAIQNAGANRRDYHWSVFLVQSGRAQRMANGHVTIAAGREAAITRSVPVPCTGSRVQVVVRLTRPAEAIDAGTTCRPPGAR